ncbi:MAG: hypothetical protein IKG14_04805 [Clostridia bacterium]|nr:hypothetical protein [Clostridia bacterium]
MNFMDIWIGKTEEDILNELSDNIYLMSEQFSICDFFDKNYQHKDSFLASIIITPMQVITSYAPEIENRRIQHQDLVNTILKESGTEDIFPRIRIDCNSSDEIMFCLCKVETEKDTGISKEMYIAFQELKYIIETIAGDELVLDHNFDDLNIQDCMTNQEIPINYKERLVGIPINDYMKTLEKEKQKSLNVSIVKSTLDSSEHNRKENNKEKTKLEMRCSELER